MPEDPRFYMALWYAYGVIDSGVIPGIASHHAYDFAFEQEKAKSDFDENKVHYLPSIMVAWSAYLERKGLSK